MFITPTNPIILDPSGPAGHAGSVSPLVGIILTVIFGGAILGMTGCLAWLMWKCR
jgi:hypothetical protein